MLSNYSHLIFIKAISLSSDALTLQKDCTIEIYNMDPYNNYADTVVPLF